MSLMMELCVLVVTAALVVIASSTFRAMRRVEVAIEDFRVTTEAVRSSVAQAEAVSREVHGVATAVHALVPRLQGVVSRFERVGERAARVSDSVLDEVEPPIRSAIAVVGGVRAGARTLANLWTRRSRGVPSNGGNSHA